MLRRATFQLYPNEQQLVALEGHLELYRQIYNWALEQLISADKDGRPTSYNAVAKQFTQHKKAHPQYKAINAQSAQNTIKRASQAMDKFYERCEAGEKAGYPRFKKKGRFKGWGYNEHGDGNKVFSNGKHGKIRISGEGIGLIKMRGKARTVGEVRTVNMLRKNSTWFSSVVYDCMPVRIHGEQQRGIDAGLMTYATIANADGTYEEIENPRFLNKLLAQIKQGHKVLSRKQKGSKNWNKQKEKLAGLYDKLENQRTNFAHQVSNKLVKESSLLATEDLDIQKMVAKGGSYKTGLNRSILDASWRYLINAMEYKAEEAGILLHVIPTKTVKPSQTCPNCGLQEKKQLSERRHECDCGLRLSRDQAAARVILNWALFKRATGREPTWCGGRAGAFPQKHETHAIVTK